MMEELSELTCVRSAAASNAETHYSSALAFAPAASAQKGEEAEEALKMSSNEEAAEPKQEAAEAVTMLLATPNANLIEPCTHAVMMDDGQVLEAGEIKVCHQPGPSSRRALRRHETAACASRRRAIGTLCP